MTLGNVVNSQSHSGHNAYTLYHCKQYFYISLFQLKSENESKCDFKYDCDIIVLLVYIIC